MDLPDKEGDLLESGPVQPPGPTLEELEEKLRALRRIIEAALVALVFLSVGVNSYMWRQSRMLSRQLEEARRFLADYQQNKEPTIRGFISSLQSFAKSHPEIQPILTRYNIEPSPVRPAVAPTNTPAPKSAK